MSYRSWVVPQPQPLFHAFLDTFCRRGTASQQSPRERHFTPALLRHLLLVEVPCSLGSCLHTPCWLVSEYSICEGKNTSYLRLTNPHPAASRRIIFFFLIVVTHVLFAMRSEAPLTRSAFCSSCSSQIDLLFFRHVDIFRNIHTALG